MWPLLAWLLLYPLSLPAADWLTRQAGRERAADSPEAERRALRFSLALYLAAAAVLAAYGLLTLRPC